MKHGCITLAGLLFIVACGNYSNDDIDFQFAMPDPEDLVARTPQALTAADSAEYLTVTRDIVVRFNVLIGALTSLVDRVRALPPTGREGETRIWGPFPHERDRAWELRMTMTRGIDPTAAVGFRFLYAFEFRRVGAGGMWTKLMFGTFAPGGGARRGSGQLELSIAAARAAGYPVAEYNDLQTLRVTYDRAGSPKKIDLSIENVATAESPGGTYVYRETPEGGGAMTFTFRVRDNIFVQALGMESRWRADGAGRADARVAEGLAALRNAVGVDCWGNDGRATYSRRDFDPKRLEGAPETCVFPAP
jgi:hypothetical protein